MILFWFMAATNCMPKVTQYVHDLGDHAQIIHIPKFSGHPDKLFNELLEKIPWKKFKYQVGDKEVLSPRLMQVVKFGDELDLPCLLRLKKRLEKMLTVQFNYAVLNYYRDGQDYIGYHADREVSNGQIVASISLGATRRFVLKHKHHTNVRHVFMPENGDLLILNDAAIKHAYKHSVPKMANVGPRISITFRE